jgi:hypothetical protein
MGCLLSVQDSLVDWETNAQGYEAVGDIWRLSSVLRQQIWVWGSLRVLDKMGLGTILAFYVLNKKVSAIILNK